MVQAPGSRPDGTEYDEATMKKLEKIPDWVALNAVGGALIFFVCLVLIFITCSSFAAPGLVLGLILLAISLKATHHAIYGTQQKT
jgi:mannose/fructose/N-acetylgalactosamine-specific phosphotransferase system component IID